MLYRAWHFDWRSRVRKVECGGGKRAGGREGFIYYQV
jgi:hypothetical protein